MNGGVLNAIETMSDDERKSACDAYAFFGLERVSELLLDAKANIDRGVDDDTYEAKLDTDYRSVVPDDARLYSAFAARFHARPTDFSATD